MKIKKVLSRWGFTLPSAWIVTAICCLSLLLVDTPVYGTQVEQVQTAQTNGSVIQPIPPPAATNSSAVTEQTNSPPFTLLSPDVFPSVYTCDVSSGQQSKISVILCLIAIAGLAILAYIGMKKLCQAAGLTNANGTNSNTNSQPFEPSPPASFPDMSKGRLNDASSSNGPLMTYTFVTSAGPLDVVDHGIGEYNVWNMGWTNSLGAVYDTCYVTTIQSTTNLADTNWLNECTIRLWVVHGYQDPQGNDFQNVEYMWIACYDSGGNLVQSQDIASPDLTGKNPINVPYVDTAMGQSPDKPHRYFRLINK